MRRRSLGVALAVAAGLLTVCLPAAAATVYPVPPATTTAVDSSPGDQTDPHVSGTLVSYTDFAAGTGTIRYRDLATGASGAVPMTTPGSDSLSAVSGDTIAYIHFGGGSHSIYTYTPGAAAPVEIDPMPSTNRRTVAIGAASIVWQDFGLDPNVSPEIVAYDRATGVSTRLTDDSRYDRDPSVDPSGNAVTWSKCTSIAYGCDIWDATLSNGTWTVRQLTSDPGEETQPHTDGTVVTYVSDRGGDMDVRWQPVGGGAEQSLTIPGTDQNPHVSGDDHFVTFEHYNTNTADQTSNFELYGYDPTTDALYEFTDSPEDESLNDVSVGADGSANLVFSRREATGDDNVYATAFVLAAVSRTQLTTTSAVSVTALTVVRLRADVTSSGGPTGSVQFAANGVALGAPVALARGIARLATRLPAGIDQVTATYLGDAQTHPSDSAPMTFTVNRLRSTTTLLATDADSATQGLRAQVSSAQGTPAGAVQFFAGSSPLGPPAMLDESGTAVSTTPLPPGAIRVNAHYLGDDTYLPSISAGLNFVVPRMTTTVRYGPTARDGSARAIIAVHVRAIAGHPAPTGQVMADAGFHCTPLAVQSNQSTTTCSARIPQNTTETVTAHYSGDETYAVTDASADVSLGGW